MLKGDNYDSGVGALFLFCVLCNSCFVNTYGGVFRQNIIHNWGMMFFFVVIMFGISWLCLSPTSEFSCLYRVNCDTSNSLASKNLGFGLFQKFSELGGAGLVGGCFLGPLVKEWQQQISPGYCGGASNCTQKFIASCPQKDICVTGGVCSQPCCCHAGSHGYWLPNRANECKPPASYSLNATEFGCDGPNNCFSGDYKMILFACLVVYILVNHIFVKYVLQGPVAATLRERQQQRDARKLRQGSAQDTDEDASEAEDELLQDDAETSDDEVVDGEGSTVIVHL